MRRLPVFLLLDVSDSMVGEPHRYLEQGVNQLAKSLRQDPSALETVYLSVIAFAGKAKTLVPLIDLPTFYPPRLPIGSGTSLGLALDHLMDEIDRQVVATTAERRGDWKPIVYLFTDGKPTDEYQSAIIRWQNKYAKRAWLIAVGLGPYVDAMILSQFADEVLSYNGEDEADFAKFIQWVTLSVRSQSIAVENNQSLAVAGAISLEKSSDLLSLTVNQPPADNDCVVLQGRCQQRKLPYLIKYDRMPGLGEMGINLNGIGQDQTLFHIAGCYPVEEEYFEWSDVVPNEGVQPLVDVKNLVGGAGCPYCGNGYVFGLCGCGRLFCVGGAGTAHCPWCDQTIEMTLSSGDEDDDFTVERSRG